MRYIEMTASIEAIGARLYGAMRLLLILGRTAEFGLYNE
jgi:hypothetical protein